MRNKIKIGAQEDQRVDYNENFRRILFPIKIDPLVILSTNLIFFLIKLEEPVRKIMNPAFNFVFGRHLGPKFDFFADRLKLVYVFS